MTQNNMEVVANQAAKILRRYESDVPAVKQFLRDGEDRVLVSALTSAQAEIATQKQANEALMRERANIIETKREQLARLTARAEAAEKDRDALRDALEKARSLSKARAVWRFPAGLRRLPTTGAQE